ncbi:DUF4199 domain-containing protein [Parapedobacter sp. ISTM3]|uniref:DUF4199 domain-containing protein n=1 Tax=Parapedobacter luteus TaxID=623280 RepID=A0A1T5BKN3_9SPHI|nr:MULTISPECIES: DUF4199 domain-containing protein [Parapedobacter]MBK1439432.1 DUF4199 domain-containing protein [Parapedobacter sp. ISTM3]SKB47871.1 Protein of unknown function [Parapedobacter luteus]
MHTIKYGILFALAIFLWVVIEWLVGLHDRYIRYHEYLSYFFAVPSVYILYRGIRGGADQPNGRLSFRRVFAKGLGISLVATCLCPLVWYVYCVVINPAFLEHMTRFSIEVKEVDSHLASERFSLPVYLSTTTVSTALTNVITCFVIAVVVAERKR